MAFLVILFLPFYALFYLSLKTGHSSITLAVALDRHAPMKHMHDPELQACAYRVCFVPILNDDSIMPS
uniref:Putative secreted protein n=1 Tax=Ixodes scapularis TaxID=6945 RepID=A0A4D5RGY8_IXOSC